MISVCMAAHNGEKFIKKQIDSILKQLGENDELIISDDGSIDSTLDIIKKINDERIKLIQFAQPDYLFRIRNSGNFYLAASNFENAIKYSKGDYIFLSDQDDIWKAGKINRMLEALTSSDCVHCSNSVIDSKGDYILNTAVKELPKRNVFYNLLKTPFLGCCMAFRREALKYILPFPKKCIGHDLWIGCLCAYNNKLVYVNEPLHLYRIHEKNVSPAVSKKSKNNFCFKIFYRLNFLLSFYKRLMFLKIKYIISREF